ncbi:MAG: tandem-95 repeat protein, partial [Planctomycetes bacterium]|nr:tandem-95 repeat protein [Planctomycetota bacterium]
MSHHPNSHQLRRSSYWRSRTNWKRLVIEKLEDRRLLSVAPEFLEGLVVGEVQFDQIIESSGMVASRQNDDVFWVHNDSGDAARLFAMNTAGVHLGIYRLVGMQATDWEDIAIGPGPEAGVDYLYISDTGDNSARRDSVTIFRLKEPVVDAGQEAIDVDLLEVESFEIKYPDGARDAETLLVDPLSGDVVIVSKRDEQNHVYLITQAELTGDGPITPTLVGMTTWGNGADGSRLTGATAGDVSPDGLEILLKNYDDVFYYQRDPGQTIAEALIGVEPAVVPYADESKGEAITFDPATGGYFTVNEISPRPIYFYERVPDVAPPTAEVILPLDNGPLDADPADGQLLVRPQLDLLIQLTDVRVDDASVTAATVSITRDAVAFDAFSFSYDAASDVIRLLADGATFSDGSYEIILSGGEEKIADVSGNEMSATTITVLVDSSLPPRPTAIDDAFAADEAGTLTIDAASGVLANDRDADEATAVLVDDVEHGQLALGDDGSLTYSPEAGFLGQDRFTYFVETPLFSSEPATVTITIVPEAPLATDDSYQTAEDGPLVIAVNEGVLANDTDRQDDPLTAVLVDGPRSGSLTLHGDGSFSYEPDENFFGADTFSYRADDGDFQSNVAVVQITVTPVNDPPLAVDDEFTTALNTPLEVTSTVAPPAIVGETGFQEPAVGAMRYVAGSGGDRELGFDGSMSGSSVGVQEFGAGNQQYLVHSGTIQLRTDLVDVTLYSALNVSVGVRTWETSGGSDFEAGEDTIRVFVEVSDDGQTFSAIDVTPGTLTGGSGRDDPDDQLKALDNGEFGALTTFDVDIPVEFAFVRIAIEATNTSSSERFMFDDVRIIGTPLQLDGGLLANDVDVDRDVLSVVLVDDVNDGTLELEDDGTFIYTPREGFIGIDAFTYVASDGEFDSNLATVTLNVVDVNIPPTADNDAYVLDEDSVLDVSAAAGVLANDSDANGDALTAALVDGPEHGSLSLNSDGSLTYTPEVDFFGSDTFSYRAGDGEFLSDPATVTITVEAVNDAPVATGEVYEVAINSLFDVAAPGVLANDSDVEGDPLTAELVDDVSAGQLTFSSDGSFSYTAPAAEGDVTFTYRAHDGAAFSSIVTVTLSVRDINFPPVANDDAYSLDENNVLDVGAAAGVLDNDSDANGDALSAALASGPGNGTLQFNPDGSFTYTPNASFFGTDTFTYRANDGDLNSDVATVTITVRPVGSVPVALDDSFSVREDEVLESVASAPPDSPYVKWEENGHYYGVVFGDRNFTHAWLDAETREFLGAEGHVATITSRFENDFLMATVLNDTSARRIYIGAYQTIAGTFRWINGETFGFFHWASGEPANLDDQGAVEIVKSANWTWRNVSRDLRLEAYLIEFDVAPQVGILDNDHDDDGDELTAALVDDVQHGDLVLSGDGSFSYTPEADFFGTDVFTYRAGDGELTSDVATVTITVEPVNDAPVAEDDAYELNAGGTLDVDAETGLLANDSDIDSADLAVVLVVDAAHGSLALDPNGSFTYAPDVGFFGSDTFTYRATDGELESALTTVTIDMSGLSDFGDAPLPYPTTLADDGARHEATGPTLGATRDADLDGQPSTDADGDGSDEDGVTFGAIMVGQLDAGVTVNIQNAPGGAKLDAWFDFNGDGTWGGPGEQVFDNVRVNNGNNVLLFDVPSWAASGNTYARFRLSTAGDLGVGGSATDGEVEDYQVAINPPATATGNFGGQNIIGTSADGAVSVVAADIDGDGDMDVLSASDTTIAWYENDGSQGFTAHTISSDANSSSNILAADVDGDGDVDVIGAGNNKIVWYENDGSGGFTARTISTDVPGVISVFAADIDGDGDVDVLSGSSGDGNVTWYENDGSEGFTAHTIRTNVDQIKSVFAADMDGDGDMDVLSASFLGGIALYRNNGSQSFVKHTVGAVVSPIDLDGFSGTETVIEFGPPSFNATRSFTYSGVTVSILREAGYLVANGSLAVLFENIPSASGGRTLSTYASATKGTHLRFDFSVPVNRFGLLLASGSVTSWELTAFDDNLLPLGTITATMPGASQATFGGFEFPNNIARVEIHEPRSGQSDAFDDIRFEAADIPGTSPLTVDGLSGMFPADVDGDGRMDVLVAAINSNNIAWFKSLDADRFEFQNLAANVRGATSVFPADVDGDGDLDVFSASLEGGTIAWYEQDGSEGFAAHSISTAADGATSVFAVDMDGDGDLDVLSGSFVDGKIAWYENILLAAASDNYTAQEDQMLSVPAAAGVLANDFDLQGGSLSAVLDVDPQHGQVNLGSDGSFTYLPEENFFGTDSFRYRARSDSELSAAVIVTITVEPLNDAPVAVVDEYAVDTNAVLTVNATIGLLANDTDIDGDTLAASLEDGPTHGSLIFNPDGSFTYTPLPGFSGDDFFTYRATDADETSDVARVSILVGEPVVDVRLAVVATPSASDVADAFPNSLTEAVAGTSYFVELWLQDVGSPGVGLAGGSVDISFTTAPADVVGLSHGQTFNLLPSGSVDDAAGLVDDFGGGSFSAGVGVAPRWARLGYVEVLATGAGEVTFSLSRGALEFSRFGEGFVDWDGVNLLDTITVRQVGSSIRLDATVVRSPSETDAGGEIEAVPTSAAFLHEWEAFWVEVWGSTPAGSDVGIAGATFDLVYNTDLATAARIEYGPAFRGSQSGVIDDTAGIVSDVGASATRGDVGDDRPVLLVRVLFEPTAGDQAIVDALGHRVGPYDLGIRLTNVRTAATTTEIGPLPQTELWAVIYDVDDFDTVNFGDFSFFAAAFEHTVGEAEPPLTWWADFDKSGLVDFGDFSFFAASLTANKNNGAVAFPDNYPEAWRPDAPSPAPGRAPEAAAAPAGDLEVQLVARDSLSAGDTLAALPDSLSAV